MAKITASGDLVMATTLGNLGVDGNVFVDVSTKLIHLADYLLLNSDGVTIQALYSKLKTEWKDDVLLDLIQYDFPMVAIHPEQFEFVDGWAPATALTQDYFRDGGYAVKNLTGTSAEEYFCVITLGDVKDSLGADGQIYYQLDSATTTVADIVLKGTANQCVRVYNDGGGHGVGDSTNVVLNDTRNYFKIFAREFKMLYDASSKEAIGLLDGTLITYQAYRFPLSNGNDLAVPTAVTTDGQEATLYPDIEIDYLQGHTFDLASAKEYTLNEVGQDNAGRWFRCSVAGTLDAAGVVDYTTEAGTGTFVAFEGEKLIGSDYYPFTVIVDGDSLGTTPKYTIQEIYARVQYELRQATNIDEAGAGDFTIQGNASPSLLYFVGSTLNTASGFTFNSESIGKAGVFVADQLSADTNSIDFYDANDGYRFYPFVSALTLNFNEYLKADGEVEDATDAKYTLFYEYTVRYSSAALAAVTPTAGSSATITMTDVDFTAVTNSSLPVSATDYILISGMTEDINNGVWLVDSADTATQLTCTKVGGGTPLTETAQTATLDMDAFGTPDSFVVLDNASQEIKDIIDGVYVVSKDYNYDGNLDGHKGFGVDANVICVALGDNKAQYVKATGTIERTKANPITLTAALERNFVV